jgi:uncharacterized membrane protein
MGDGDDDGNNAVVKRVLWDPQGNLRHDRALDAIRGRRSHHADLVPRLVGLLLAGGAFGLVSGYLDYGTVAGTLEGGAMFAVAAAMFGTIWVTERLESYYEADEELAVEELRARYARGELPLERFQEQVDRVYDEGAGWVFEEDDDEETADGTADAAAGTDEDPEAILKRRFARGELSEAEYRSRVAALAETGVDVAGIAEEPDPERAGE